MRTHFNQKCALEQEPDWIAHSIWYGFVYQCDMCNSIIKVLTVPNHNPVTIDGTHSMKFRNQDIRKVCKVIKLRNELIEAGVIKASCSDINKFNESWYSEIEQKNKQ
jgi:hypothetical protein